MNVFYASCLTIGSWRILTIQKITHQSPFTTCYLLFAVSYYEYFLIPIQSLTGIIFVLPLNTPNNLFPCFYELFLRFGAMKGSFIHSLFNLVT
jgi:hypothetical protein